VDYALMIDADDVLEIKDIDIEYFKESLTHDYYDLTIKLGNIEYYRPQLFNLSKPLAFRGVVHEFFEAPPSSTTAKAHGLTILAGVHGSRSKDPQKYLKDAVALEMALLDKTDPFMRSRYTFYLAQSYKDAGQLAKAEEAYFRRTEMGGWDEEIFLSLLEIAYMQAERGAPFEQVMGLYGRAMPRSMKRHAEVAYAATRFCRGRERFSEGYSASNFALLHNNTAPVSDELIVQSSAPSGLFVKPWIYHYGLLDEFSLCAYYTGHYQESLHACERILKTDIDEATRQRVTVNFNFAKEKLA